MAKVKSIVQLNGTIGGINFYMRKGVAVARAAGGGFNGDAIKSKPSMVRVRENGNEFKGCMKSVQFFKQGLMPYLHLFKDGLLHQRMVRLFTQLKDLDGFAERGHRSVSNGLKSDSGKALLRNYVISSGKGFGDVIKNTYRYDWTTGLTLDHFDGTAVAFSDNATHLELGIGYLVIDFEQLTFSFTKSEFVYLTAGSTGTISIPKPDFEAGTGYTIGVVFGRLGQQVNGDFYPLKGELNVVLEVLGVGE